MNGWQARRVGLGGPRVHARVRWLPADCHAKEAGRTGTDEAAGLV